MESNESVISRELPTMVVTVNSFLFVRIKSMNLNVNEHLSFCQFTKIDNNETTVVKQTIPRSNLFD